jgi:lipopolysaccharide export system permease protein
LRTLYKYIFSETWPPFAASLVVFVFIVLAARILNIAEWVVNHGVQPSQMVGMVGYLLPGMILFALPAAVLMAVFVAFLRLSNDNEILALKASGVSLYQMLPPVVVISTLCFVAALLISLIGAPWGQRSFKDLVFEIAHSKADLGIQERVFSDAFSGLTFYVNSFSERERIMEDVFIVDRRDPFGHPHHRGKEGANRFSTRGQKHCTPLCGRDDLHLGKENGGCPDHRVRHI